MSQDDDDDAADEEAAKQRFTQDAQKCGEAIMATMVGASMWTLLSACLYILGRAHREACEAGDMKHAKGVEECLAVALRTCGERREEAEKARRS